MSRLSLLVPALLLTLLPPAVAADGGFQPGEGFQLDGLYFHVVSVSPEAGALFRVAGRLPATTAEEHPGCYRVGRAFYHQEACPALQQYFARAGADADSAAAAPPANRTAYGTGSHPIDYLRGSYVEPDRSYGWSYAGLFYAPRYFHGRGFGLHGRPGPGFRGRSPGFGFRGGRGFGVTLRGW